MIDVKYTTRNVQLKEEQKELLKHKVQRKFAKYKEDMKFDVKITFEKNRYIISILGKFKKHVIETKDEGYEITKLLDVAMRKMTTQVRKVESKIRTH